MDENLQKILDTDINSIAEQGKSKNKRRAELIAVTIILTAATIAALITIPPYIEMQNAYDTASELLLNGKYEDAQHAFTELGNYKNSTIMAQESSYQWGTNLLAGGKYKNAETIFTELGNYKDSTNMAKESAYLWCKQCLTNGNAYSTVVSTLQNLSDYKDSQDLLIEAQYLRAIDLMNRKSYASAIKILSELENYKDSESLLEEAVLLQNKIIPDISSTSNASHTEKPPLTTSSENTVHSNYHGKITLNYSSYFLKDGETLQLKAVDSETGEEVNVTWSLLGLYIEGYVLIDKGNISKTNNYWGTCGILATAPNGSTAVCTIIAEASNAGIISKDGSRYVYTSYPSILSIDNAVPNAHFRIETQSWDANGTCIERRYIYQAEDKESASNAEKAYAQFLQNNGYTLSPNTTYHDYSFMSPDNTHYVKLNIDSAEAYKYNGATIYGYDLSVEVGKVMV